jgi:hypothetical protein
MRTSLLRALVEVNAILEGSASKVAHAVQQGLVVATLKVLQGLPAYRKANLRQAQFSRNSDVVGDSHDNARVIGFTTNILSPVISSHTPSLYTALLFVQEFLVLVALYNGHHHSPYICCRLFQRTLRSSSISDHNHYTTLRNNCGTYSKAIQRLLRWVFQSSSAG